MIDQKVKIWEALAKYGINTKEEFDAALKELQPLNIGVMVSPVNLENEDSEESIERI